MNKTRSIRQGRVNDVIQREIAKYVQANFAMSDFGMITICEVDVSADFAHAKVFFTVMPKDKLDECTHALQESAGAVRKQLSQTMTMRTVPKLKFIYDDTVSKGNYLHDLIDSTRPENLEEE